MEHFESFAPDLAEMVDRAFKEEWIDFYPRNGKRGGAFCSNLPFIGQSRILTNFSGSFGSVVTLAHELGHAYHGQQIQDHRPLNTGYTMPVAETASNFNELIIVNDAIAKSSGAEKIGLIESQIQDCTQIILDIYSRFLFEDEVIRRRKNTFLFAKDLEKIMLDAQTGQCDVAFIDYLGLITHDDKRKTLAQIIGDITKRLKNVAGECNIPIVLLCQLNRESAKENRSPQLTDLRDSGSIEQDADVVMMLERPRDEMGVVEDNKIDLWVRKNRGGKCNFDDAIHLVGNESYSQFYEIAKGEQYQPENFDNNDQF